jgi:multiple sugar transport system ATP-binding protein
MDHAELSELAADSGMEDLPRHGDAQQIVARLSAESKAAPGSEVEMTVDTTQMKLFAADSGRSMTAAAA